MKRVGSPHAKSSLYAHRTAGGVVIAIIAMLMSMLLPTLREGDRRVAFTLIELLVVIAIIALLISIFLLSLHVDLSQIP